MLHIIKKMLLLKTGIGKSLLPNNIGNFEIYLSKYVLCSNFYEYESDLKFQTILSILPPNSLKKNIYYIDKCLRHLDKNGELIIYSASSLFKNSFLAKKLYDLGTITDIIKERKIIWRFVKGDFNHNALVNGQWGKIVLKDRVLRFI